ncbi:phospho-N-acetylmuramoyl-pentapeptide-transferase [Candidatus Roizmanbacteria bacterium RIFCSPHIGHO2_02_FULL_37_15]|uniref:Phospho-N-acetylmuramoyl-pentapeptide-transferase n=1 Tax=Candidatus Roizmanbacteria bacterium RIFCSPLOWO2_01_FULL_37_16 TaxID=1802058 RepID=A0A1F7IIR7_9BACT|nr:MAG: phospho-N-acetylmuramoyl-pentapeptide-transferase [Candidatus Roizmanbacteria bacterium RIFCSPHIGHO2_01_FULL_37_16b]OGK20407.1 MAG: phospho-N-acetylmuramoyl-pentapeptide-transferase [Candidatus Roizmanbacteria bacterium RIFCSPHIGHO2_02_FULL_37_15]OGK34008.1 MAG: phospho-N-acetylmuramoyl-pentapeptide-transferase [Candidatus Roizmanbacteria bacterium RIFCSPHIGHO2_12_FULL_36_11]OGK43258.1 MAG: phospho-N-acetylmuramoyl-pentapeptide-transferase [Candidatus Roizmanbacteria bacterium RIFCSPLOWO
MSLYLFILFISSLINFLIIVPFINFLYKKKFQRIEQKTKDAFNKPTPIFDKFHQHKKGTPVGGGILLLLSTVFMFFLSLLLFFLLNKKIITSYPSIITEIKIILFTFLSFGLLGVYDDLNKIFFLQKGEFFGLRLRHKFIIEVILALIISYWLFTELKIEIIHIPFIGVFDLSWFYILFATFVIVAFANAVNITDGLDGLASGILLFALTSFWAIASSILDVPTTLFIATWLGGLIAFLYFNIYPARIFLGDSGALSFGATFAVIGLILGKVFALIIIGGVFVIEILSSLIQLLGKKFLAKKIFPVAPFHLWLQYKGWEEPKIVMRLWIITILFAVLGLMVSFGK